MYNFTQVQFGLNALIKLYVLACQIFVCISESQESHSATTEYLQLSITGVEASAELRKDTMQASLRVGSLGLEDQASECAVAK